MKLAEKQILFSEFMDRNWLPGAIRAAAKHGYRMQLREAWRSEASARANAASGSGIVNSNHRRFLARDYMLWKKQGKKWVPERDSAKYEFLGKLWEKLSGKVDGVMIECCWGGRFRKPDGGHFSFKHGKVK